MKKQLPPLGALSFKLAMLVLVLLTGARTKTSAQCAGTISGTSSLCVGATSTLSSTVSAGTWSTIATNVATVGSSSGIVTAISGGVATITYTAGSCFSTYMLTVNPNAGTISGAISVAVG